MPALILAGAASAASAADLPSRSAPPAPPSPVAAPAAWPSYEVRLGVFAHDPWSPESGSVDINGEVLTPRLFSLPNPSFNALAPRLHAGATVNTAGKTSSAYAGFTWTVDVVAGFFVEASLGGAVHNGKTGDVIYPDWNALGCSPLFRESASIGYRFTEKLSVMATVEHLSNAGTCSQNRGLTNAGLRLGYSF
ncbi:acyloxyacyl hydrolase [Alsobacter sp. R-9]